MKDLTELTREAVSGLGLDLVDVERAALGLLRITIDHQSNDGGGVTIEDCEKVSKQLSRLYEVEGIDYRRLEVGSPGVDRPLRSDRDFFRFVGERIEVKLHEAFENRRIFQGVLALAPANSGKQFLVEYQEGKGEAKQLLFDISDVDRAKLDPLLDFKGRKR